MPFAPSPAAPWTAAGAAVSLAAGTPGGGGGLTASTLISSGTGGFWHAWVNPRAFYYNGKTYFSYISSTGSAVVAEYNHAGGTVIRTGLAALGEVDYHDVPALIMRDDHKLVCVYMKHNVSYARMRISTNAEDSTAWGSEVDIDVSLNANNKTYPNLVKLSGDTAGTLRLFFRNYNGTNWGWRQSISTDSGASWGAAVQMHSTTTNQGYMFIADNGTDTIHFVVTDTIPVIGNVVKMAHKYWTGGSYYKSDGTLISVGEQSQLYADCTEFWTGAGGAAPWESDFIVDASGYPRVVHYDGYSSTDWRYNLSRWNGTTWSHIELASGYDSWQSIGNAGGLCFDDSDANRLFVAHQAGGGGTYEMYAYMTTNDWASWTETPITSSSSTDQTYPLRVRNSAAGARVLWLSGTFVNSGNFSFDLKRASE